MFNFTLTTPISLFVSLVALTGVALHDTKLDKLATNFAGIPAMMTQSEGSSKSIGGDPHTHVERMSLKDVHAAQPRLAPRADQRKHLMQKNMPKGAQGFDGYAMPLAPSLI